jgi:thioester reductase-like protein
VSQYLLLTGATGLVGRFLIRDLLRDEQRVAVLVRRSTKASAAERVEQIMQLWERQTGELLPRSVCLEGDVSEPGLGLSAKDRQWLVSRCGRVLHGAAALDFDGPDRRGEPWRTNVEGTRHVLELCRELAVTELHYVSTAYVSGIREDVVREDELEMGQEFRNDYEQSKYEAEKLVRSADWISPPTIYRPTVISGDSRSGYTNTYHGIYIYLRLISVLLRNTKPDKDGRRYTPFRAPMCGDERRNIVPADWVSDVICYVLKTAAAHGRTFHLAPRVPLTMRSLIDSGYRYFDSYGVEYMGPEWQLSAERSRFEEAYLDIGRTYRNYELSDPEFDTSNLQHFAGQLPCPEIDDSMLRLYWEFGERDRWGKRREAQPNVDKWAAGILQEAVSRTDGLSPAQPPASRAATVGFDVHGAGGGQFHVSCAEEGELRLQRGLPPNGAPVHRLTVEGLERVAVSAEQLVESLVDSASSECGGGAPRL